MQSTPSSEYSSLSREQLQGNLERLSRRLTLFEATERVAKIGHFEWSRVHQRLESCSMEYANLFNMTVEETLASHNTIEKTLLLIHPEDREHYMNAIRAMEVDKTLEVEFRIRLKDGSIKHVREFAISILDVEGTETGSFGLMQDITRQVRYERDLESRDKLARQSEEITDIGHFIYDEENETYLYLSEGYARIHGQSIDYFMKSIRCFVDDIGDVVEEDRERVADEYRYYIDNGRNCAIEYRIRRADGAIRWVRELDRPRAMKNGRVSQTLGVMQDITDQVLREQELTFKDAMANQAEALTDIGYFMYDLVNSRHQYVSHGQARIFGMGVDEFLGKIRSSEDYLELIYEPDRDRLREIYLDSRGIRNGWQEEYRIRRLDGELRWVREIGKAHKRNGDRVEQTIGVVQDITEQKKIEQELRYKDALANQAEAITEIGHFVYDEIRQKYLFASPGLARILGKQVEDLLQNSPMGPGGIDVVHPDDREMVQKTHDRFLADGDEWQVDYRLLRNDGEVRWIRELGKAHLMGHGIPEQTIGVLQDITAQKNAERAIISARDTLEQQVVERTRELANTVKQLQIEIEEREKIAAELHFLANHDALTGLPSLRLCKDRLDQSLAEARRNRQTSAVMFLDLDGFKEINDRYGHEFGDSVLRETAQRITIEIRETDTVARIGGDEFVIILSSLPESSIANRIARGLVNEITRPLDIDGVEVTVSASIGISLYPENGLTAEELIRSADKAMYCIKRAGKNNFGFVESAGL
ncbi:MAG: PAS domain-containing protein [Gammaproteobacteria bacterium]|nr:PAS domain-containing protein [Gammaproteobacteria bacterium]